MNIYLCGFQGVGKTHHGKRLARTLFMPFHDVDEEILLLHPAPSIRALHQQIGEHEFRKIEEKIVETLSRKQNCLIALGGGSLESKASQDHVLKTGKLYYLYKPLEQVRPKSIPHYIQEPFETFFTRRHTIFSTLAHHTIQVAHDWQAASHKK